MRVMFNEDWIHFFWTRYENNIDVTNAIEYFQLGNTDVYSKKAK